MTDLDQMTTEVFNAVGSARSPQAHEPIADVGELDSKNDAPALAEWNLIRLVLEHIPARVLKVLSKLRVVD